MKLSTHRASAARFSDANTSIAALASTVRDVADQRALKQKSAPVISILTPTWNTDPRWFAELAISIIEQSFAGWEWCIVDDGSTDTRFHELFDELRELSQVKITRLKTSKGISAATNEALRSASGEYVCCVDHDDLLTPNSLAECVRVLRQGFDAVYTDSDKIDQNGFRSEPFHKPSWSPEYFRGVMYVGHLLCVRRDLALAIGGFDSRFDGVQDFDFFLRYSEGTQRIGHVDQILYHWRMAPGSLATAVDAKDRITELQRKAVQVQLERLSLPANATHGKTPHRIRIVPKPRLDHPLVSIIIPTKDAADILSVCLTSIAEKTTYPKFEVIGVDNETTDARAISLMRDAGVRRIAFPGRFNFSRANNIGARHARGEYLVLMNNDIEVIHSDWIEQMLYYAEQPDVGCVGALLLYPNRTVQHAGVVLGCRGTADHLMRGFPEGSDGYAGSMSCARETSAVTAACMMIRRSLYKEIGGFNEHFFTAYQDVDLCLKAAATGKRNVFTPNAVLVHHESYSRGKYYDHVDHNLLLDLWGDVISAGDRYYNSHFDVQTCDYALRSA